MDFLSSLSVNLLSDVLFVFSSIFIGWVIFILSKRSQLLRFFGIGAKHRLVIYLSDLKLKPGQTFGVDDKKRMYTGSAVAFGEMQSANRFRDLLNYFLPSLSETPNFLSKLLISDVQIQIQSAPSSEGQVEKSACFVTLGSPAYNRASGFVEDRLHSKARFIWGKSPLNTITSSAHSEKPYTPLGLVNSDDVPTSMPTGTYARAESGFLPGASPAEIRPTVLPPFNALNSNSPQVELSAKDDENITAIVVKDLPNLTDVTSGFVERIIDHERRRTIYYVAGISELATVGAASYLITEWTKLQRKYGDDKDFLIMLKIEPSDPKKWNILFEK